jgi:hypothetical protein
MPRLAAVALYAAAVAAVVGSHITPADARSGPCGHRVRLTVLAKAHGAQVYVLTIKGQRLTKLCDHGHETGLDLGVPDSRVQAGSVTITASYVSYATVGCEDGCQSVINAIHRGKHPSRTTWLDDTSPRERITRVRTAASGAMAWIACPIFAIFNEPNPRLGAACPSPQRRHIVYALPAPSPSAPLGLDRTKVALKSGKGIAPFSLGITDDLVIWRLRGKLQTGATPPEQTG